MTQDIETLLSAYVDGELDAGAVAEVEAMLETDAQARRMVEMYRETAGMLRAAMAEAFFATGSERLLAPTRSQVQRASWPVAWAAAAAVAACVIGFGGGTVWSNWSLEQHDAVAAEVAEYHAVYSRETTHLVEVPAENADELRHWLGHRLERRLDIPDLTAAGLKFAGGRMLVIDGKPVADILYTRDRGAPVALCIVASDEKAQDVRVEKHGGQRVAMWSDGHYAYFVVGDLDQSLARALAERAAEQIKG